MFTEENHSLFEQVTLLRAHFDSFNRDCTAQLEEANAKSAAFDLLHSQVSQLLTERDRLLAQKLETERRLDETLRVAASVEEERRGEQLELNTLRSQLVQFRNEYVQYKAEAERLQGSLQGCEEHLAAQVRALQERDRDQGMRIQELEQVNSDLTQHHREAILEIQRLDRDLRTLLSVNEQFQL